MAIVKVSFFDILGTLWVGADNHPYIVFDARATENERSVLLTAHCSTQPAEYCINEVEKRFNDIIESPLNMVMHQNNRKSKKITKKMSKAFKDSFVSATLFELDSDVTNPLEFEVSDDEAKEYAKLPAFFTVE